MPQYLSPGVYVEEVPSAVKPIAGVGTSTAGFVGIVPDTIVIPQRAAEPVVKEQIGTGDAGGAKTFKLAGYPVLTETGNLFRDGTKSTGFTIWVGDDKVPATLSNDHAKHESSATLEAAPADGAIVRADYIKLPTYTKDKPIGTGDAKTKTFMLDGYPLLTTSGTFEFRVSGIATPASIDNDSAKGAAFVTFTQAPADKASITASYMGSWDFSPVKAGEPKLCTNFSEFKTYFGDFSTHLGQRDLAHAVYGFFNNGGSRCFVIRIANQEGLSKALETLAAIDEVAIVAMPGATEQTAQNAVIEHCENTQDRFAILDGAAEAANSSEYTKAHIQGSTKDSNYAAIYFPWIKVFDPVTKALDPGGDGKFVVGPSGHIAGVYARVDTERGVHKAPANEVIRGALDVQYRLSKAHQDGLNPSGVNVIRAFDSNIKIWGARTMGGDANTEFKYINVRRLFNFLRESIDEGTQWVVFEPNDPSLWAKITRNITAFLTNVWRAGALFGSTPQEAFYVKCDAETNPPALRDLGQVVTEIGVSVVKPAEFVIFRISQWAGPGK